MVSLANFLRKHQKDRRRANVLHQRIVSNDDPAGRGADYSRMQAAKMKLTGGAERTRYMLCLSIVDTAASIVSSAKPTLQYLTQAGDWHLQRKAKQRTLALTGQMRQLEVEELGPRIFRDGAVCDVGSVYGYVHPETGRVCLERVLPNEVLVDHNEAVHGSPRNRYRVRPANKERLKELYPSKKRLIEAAPCIGQEDRDDFFLTRESAAESVLVVEAWHLGRTKDGEYVKNSGRHVMCVQGATLVDEDYEHPNDFPFADFMYADMPVGWYGQSLVSRTKEGQRRINQLIKRYERCQDLASGCVVELPRASGLSPEQISNLPGQTVVTDAPGLKLHVWTGTPPDLRQEIPAIREEILQNEGLSEQQVQGEKMAGVNSAVGLRAADDIQARRHVHPQRRYERWHIDVAKLIARCNDDAAKLDPKYTVTSQIKLGRRDYIHSIPWTDVQVDENDVRLQVFPTSSLSTTPKGRRDDVMGLLQAGMITLQSAVELLDLPDLDTETANQLAETDCARWMVEEVMDGEDVLIDPILGESGLQLTLDTARKAYLQCMYCKAPDGVMDRLRDFMTDLTAEITKLKPPPAPAPMPMGAPMPPEMMPPPDGGAPLPPMTPTAGPMGIA